MNMFKTESGARVAGIRVRETLGGGAIKVRQAHGALHYIVSVTAGPITITGRAVERAL